MSFLRRYYADLTFVALSLGVLAWLWHDAFSIRSGTYTPSSDYWEHASAVRALLDDPLHPRNPQVDSAVSSPRFNPLYVLVAAVTRPFGADMLGTMGAVSVLNGVLFLTGIWWFFRSYFRDGRAPLFALIVMLGSWYNAPHYSNVYSLAVIFATAPYPSLSALALTLFALTFSVRLLRAERPTPRLALPVALGFALVVATHQLTATMAIPAALLLAFTERDVPRAQRLWLAGSVVGGVLLSGLWPYYPVFGTVLAGTAHRVAPSAHYVSSPLHEFYQPEKFRATLGFCALALLLMPYFFVRRRVMFAIVGACLMLALFVTRIVLPVPLGHRYVLLAVFNLQIVLVAGLLELVPRGSVQAKAWALPGARALAVLGVVALLGAQAFLGVQSARMRLGARAHARRADSPTVRLGRAIGRAAGKDAIVLGTALGSWVVPAFGPRVVVLLHENPLISDHRRRELDAHAFFADGTSSELRDAILARYHVTHVLLPANAAPAVRRYVAVRGTPQDLPGSSVLYALSGPRRS